MIPWDWSTSQNILLQGLTYQSTRLRSTVKGQSWMGDRTVLLRPEGRGIDLTNWYKYQQYTVIHHTDPDDGDWDLWSTVFISTLIQLITCQNFTAFIHCESFKSYTWILLTYTLRWKSRLKSEWGLMGFIEFSWVLEMQTVNQLLAGISLAMKHLSNVNTKDVSSKCFFLRLKHEVWFSWQKIYSYYQLRSQCYLMCMN